VGTDKKILTRKIISGNHQAKGKRRGKPHRPKPEKQERMPQHQHCPLAKYREDKNPKYHEEQVKDVAGIHAAHSPKTVERGHKQIDYERNVACKHNYRNAMNVSPRHPCQRSDELPPKFPSDRPTQPP
jgi:hypothetical protein